MNLSLVSHQATHYNFPSLFWLTSYTYPMFLLEVLKFAPSTVWFNHPVFLRQERFLSSFPYPPPYSRYYSSQPPSSRSSFSSSIHSFIHPSIQFRQPTSLLDSFLPCPATILIFLSSHPTFPAEKFPAIIGAGPVASNESVQLAASIQRVIVSHPVYLLLDFFLFSLFFSSSVKLFTMTYVRSFFMAVFIINVIRVAIYIWSSLTLFWNEG